MDNGLNSRWITQERDGDEWFALDDDYATLTEAREAL